ncbi:MAG: hypothetical protein HFI30_06025 [Lachnospiraceae bacterium]|jgi:DNA repair photolyase|nr:hypothetical protein [Lachnospiraceae bacterium]
MEVSYKRLWGLFTNENMKKSLHPIKIGILPEVLEIYFKKMECGITLILLDEMYRKYMEPGAATYVNRLAPLWRLHDKGCKTYVNVHPSREDLQWQRRPDLLVKCMKSALSRMV